MAVQIRFKKEDFDKLLSWFPENDNGILDPDEVLDACSGHKETGEIRSKTRKISELGLTLFEAVKDSDWTYDEVLINAVVEQIKEDCDEGDTTVVHELLEGILIRGLEVRSALENALRDSTLEAIRKEN